MFKKKLKKAQKNTSNIRVTDATLEQLAAIQRQYLTESDALVFIKMLKSNIARETAIRELHKNQHLYI